MHKVSSSHSLPEQETADAVAMELRLTCQLAGWQRSHIVVESVEGVA